LKRAQPQAGSRLVRIRFCGASATIGGKNRKRRNDGSPELSADFFHRASDAVSLAVKSRRADFSSDTSRDSH
jgi:hypothetical protein